MGNSIWTLTICVLFFANFISGIGCHHSHDHDDHGGSTVKNATLTEMYQEVEHFVNGTGIRPKRNSVGGGNNSPESLLASCQLTNLLLYQALQQQRQVNANPLLALATSNLQGLGSSLNLNNLQLGQQSGLGFAPTGPGNLLNPLAAINQNLVYPSLSTYITTSTYVTKLTTTALVTVPLLFGNKPFSTTITRTKTYDVTTSEVKTVTATATPTPVLAPQIKSSPVISQDAIVAPTLSLAVSQNEQPPDNKENKQPSEYDAYEDDTQYHNDVQEEKRVPNKKIFLRGATQASAPTLDTTTDQYVSPSKPSKTSSRGTTTFTSSGDKKQRRKTRPTSATTPAENTRSKYNQREPEQVTTTKPKSQRQSQQYQAPQDEYDYYGSSYYGSPIATTGKTKKKTSTNSQAPLQQEQFYNRQYGSSIQEDDSPIDEDPAAAQYSDDYAYYNRRLKRGEQNGEDDDEFTKLDREYLLEPSSDGDYSGNYQKYEKCPPIPANLPLTVTVTSIETRTITKFLKGQPSATPTVAQNNAYTASTSRNFIPSSTASSRRRSFKRNQDSESAGSGGYTSSTTSRSAPTTPAEKTTGDPRAQILKRGRSRYNPSQDYEYRG